MSKISRHAIDWKTLLAPLAICLYVLVYALPLQFDLALLLLALMGGAAAAWGQSRSRGTSTLLHRAVYFFLAVKVLTTVASSDIPRSATLGLAVLPGLALFFLIADYCVEQRLRDLFLAHALLALGLGLAVLTLLAHLHWVVKPGYENWMAQLGSPILLVSNDAIYLALLAPMCLALLLANASVGRKVVAGGALLLVSVLAALLQSRMMAGVLIVAVSVMMLLIRPRLAAWSIPAASLLIIVFDAARGFPLLARFSQLHVSGQSPLWDARVPIWQTAWQMFLAHPLLGHGPHTFSYVSVDKIQVSWAHNLFLETLAEQGLLGFSALLALLGSMLWIAAANYRAASGERRICAAANLTIILGLVFGAMFEISFVRQWVNELFFFAAGVAALQQAEA